MIPISPATALGFSLLTALAVLPWIVTRRRGTLDALELVYPFTALYFLEYGGRFCWLLLFPDALAEQTPHPSVVLAALPRTLFAAALGLAAYLAGYHLLRRRPVARAAAVFTGPPAPMLAWAAVILFAVGLLARAPLLAGGWFMSFAARRFAHEVPPALHSLAYLGIFTSVGYMLALAAFFSPGRPRWLGWVLAVVIVPVEALNAFLVGSKFVLMNFVAIPMLMYHYLRRRLHLAILAAAAVGFLLILVPFVNAYRLVVAIEGPERFVLPAGLPELLTRVVRQLGDLSVQEYVEWTVGLVMKRFIGIEALASVIGAIPILIPHLWGASLLWCLKILIPTVLWPGKYDALTAMLQPVPLLFGFGDFTRGGLSVTLPAELYWNFGLPGVAGGMMLLGLGHAAAVALVRRGDAISVGVYALVWSWLVLSFEGWFYALFGNVLRILIIAWVTLRAIGMVAHRRAARGLVGGMERPAALNRGSG